MNITTPQISKVCLISRFFLTVGGRRHFDKSRDRIQILKDAVLSDVTRFTGTSQQPHKTIKEYFGNFMAGNILL